MVVRLKWPPVVYSVCVVLTVLATVVALLNPATGYEVSIYRSTPAIVWVLILFNIATCILLLLRETYSNATCNKWLLPLGILVANSVLVLSMSVMRDYYAMSGGDTLMHIGYVRDLAAGFISQGNYYPALHVIPALLVKLGLSPVTATNLLPVFCYLVYVASFYMLAVTIWVDNKRNIILATTLSALLLIPCAVGVTGTFVAAAVFPLVLVALIKLWQEFNIKHLLVFVVLSGVTAMVHPIAAETLIIALVAACVVPAKNRYKMSLLAIILIVVAVVGSTVWFKGNQFAHCFGQLIESFTTSTSTATVPALVEGVQATQTAQIGGSSSSALSLILRRYIGEILLGCLAIVSLGGLVKKRIRGLRPDTRLMLVGILFLVFNIMWLVGWFTNEGGCSILLIRIMYWVPAVSIILATPLLAKVVSPNGLRQRLQRTVAITMTSVLMVALGGYAVFSLYPSSIVGLASNQITHQQVAGMTWLLENGDRNTPIVRLNSEIVSRFVAAINGAQQVIDNNSNIGMGMEETNGFSYNDVQLAGEAYPEDVYLVVAKFDKTLLRWDEDKLYLLESDPTATLVYRDGDELDIWYIEYYGDSSENDKDSQGGKGDCLECPR